MSDPVVPERERVQLGVRAPGAPGRCGPRSRPRGRTWPAGSPRWRPTTCRLAHRRLTSHSHGPGSVSSKSLMSKTRLRSGVANLPKLVTCASPHACTRRPVTGCRGEVHRHDRRRAPEERERRFGHACRSGSGVSSGTRRARPAPRARRPDRARPVASTQRGRTRAPPVARSARPPSGQPWSSSRLALDSLNGAWPSSHAPVAPAARWRRSARTDAIRGIGCVRASAGRRNPRSGAGSRSTGGT